jgi:ubiquinone/menaquinone biosynthesis C-methylase UbiE
MVERSRERANHEKVTDRVEFKVADAQNLPFQDVLFDAVITESVTAFPEDKQKAVREYLRVAKPGGYVGLNESTWLKSPPPPELVAWASQDLGASVKPLTEEEWRGMLETAGAKEIVTKIFKVDLQSESRGILRRYGCSGILGVVWRMLTLYGRSQAYREFVKKVKKEGLTPQNLDEYFGYGLYVGRK